MRRLFWFALGAALGAWAMHKFTRLTRSFTPRGVTARAAGVGARLRSRAAELRAEMTAREAELWSMLRADTLQWTDPVQEDGARREDAPGDAVPGPRLGEAARGRHLHTAARAPGRAPDGKVLDDDKDGH